MRQSLLARIALTVLLAGCAGAPAAGPDGPIGPAPCTFTNPIGDGQDPWVIRQDGWYNLVESHDGGIFVHRSEKLTDVVRAPAVRVWSAPASGWNRSNIWAPELHFIDGRWYIYYAAGESGPPYIYQRSGVLQSQGTDPLGPYTDLGMLDTGQDPAGGTIWAIDLTVQEIQGQLYAVWSGWTRNRADDATPQQLYIAPMSNPWTISGERTLISSPTQPWEIGNALSLNEGPQFLSHGKQMFIIYSTRESWLREYRLGQLRLREGADPLAAASWVKSGPVFLGTDVVYGVGHASFTTSPDGTEDWIVYHSKRSVEPGWDRVVRTQKFGWHADGSPDFGVPAAPGATLAVPAGECQP